MRILVSNTPAPGHLFRLLPLVGAVRHAGHEVALLTDGRMAGAMSDLPLLPAYPGLDVVSAEVARRVGVDVDNLGLDAATFVTGIAMPIDGGIVAQ